jgi:Ser/Thr protein kinase RdoA (MazF antagonist)
MEYTEAFRIASHFDLGSDPISVEPYGSGLINSTFEVTTQSNERFILQKINTYVFKNPVGIMENIRSVTEFLAEKVRRAGGDPARETLSLVLTCSGKQLHHHPSDDTYWRAYRFINGTTAYQTVEREGLLFEAAKAFGTFQRQLSDYPAQTLCEVIPNFHNTAARYAAFEEALNKNLAGRAGSIPEELEFLQKHKAWAHLIVDALAEERIPTRVTHNDTKLNNVLIDDETGKGICVIDLDTVMPGSLLYDFGDSVRFAANNGAEDDRDLSRVWIRPELYEEYVAGFLQGLGDSITEEELALLPESVVVLTYELALRFMTDYLDGDRYFKVFSEDHNLVRTRAQIALMKDILSKLELLHTITAKYGKNA